MKYLIGKSKFSGAVRAAAFPFNDAHLESEDNRVWEKEISETEFNKLNKVGGTFCIMGDGAARVELFELPGYEEGVH
jgi:hypothetical protein